LLLRVCLRSNLRRDPRRWPGVFPLFSGQSQLRFAVPARIALQGGERAGSVANHLSTPATKTCRRGPGCPLQDESHSGSLSGRHRRGDRLTLDGTRSQIEPGRAIPTPSPLEHTDSGVLAEPSYCSKKLREGQRSGPRAGEFLGIVRNLSPNLRPHRIIAPFLLSTG